MHFGLIGKSLKHSFSADFFAKKFEALKVDHQYNLFELSDIAAFEKLCDDSKLGGLNVTIPYKQAIIPFLDELSPEAEAIGAVNTVDFRQGKRIGHNTDAAGFEHSLHLWYPNEAIKKAMILGDGGAAKAVAFALQKNGFDFEIVSRKKQKNNLEWHQLNSAMTSNFPLWINTTPVGTFPNTNELLPLPYADFSTKNFYFDLIYNPTKTATAIKLATQGVTIQNGLDMLYAQAEKSWEIWMSED
jgi:shikimate dehydrogenase